MKKQALNKSDIIAALLENAVTIILTAFVIFMIFYRPSFSSWANITAIINDCCMYGITALGMTTVILCGEIDLSVSSIYAWSTCLFVILCNSMNVFLAALINLSLAVFNLLPIPGLDGGRILLAVIVGLRGRPFKPGQEETIHFMGMMAVLLLIVLITVGDVGRLFGG